MTNRPMSTEKFAERMKEISDNAEAGSDIDGYHDLEESHMQADGLMLDLLTALGYGRGVKIFNKMGKWYA